MGDVACVNSVGIERLILRSAEGASRRMSSSNRIVARPFVPAGAPFEAALRASERGVEWGCAGRMFHVKQTDAHEI
jgi:hypothetical protein